ncbi:glycosyl hydrolase 5 family protein-like isoform X2 [Punica granatum]|uniref:Glycosyl hydrolase 5 family protein-like isoform X2 n=1 Tax=Punica granatum TaxID=22663 RepID=A0A6P8E8A1_PUNGR|nr:glycosyl hydrolase 5 family protein-like isoform X2 [Punica granatum]
MALILTKELHSPLTLLLLVSYSCIGLVQVGPIAVQAQGPLFTDSRWIVDGAGRRVKLACVNWPSHLQPMLAEGLSKQPADVIMKKIKSMGFNCVRFTWPLELVTNGSLASRTVNQSFQGLGLSQALAGIAANNSWAPDLTLIDAFKWSDGNGFFGDKFFDPNLWVNGLIKMARLATSFPNVIGMSLRNELRGPRSNVDDWYKYMQQGAEAVHTTNPNVLVILSGLNYDTDLSFLQNRSIHVSFARKLVFEVHWYSFSDGRRWTAGNLNDLCGNISSRVMARAGFLARKNLSPLFLSEFGVDGRGTNAGDNRYLPCILAMAATEDWDFAIWALQGSYYLREGVMDMEEFYGLLDDNWSNVRNLTLLTRLSSLQIPYRGLPLKRMHMILFHPQTGLCVTNGPPTRSLRLSSCRAAQAWMYGPQRFLQAEGTKSFLQAVGPQKPPRLAPSSTSQWDMVSNSGLHLSAKAMDGSTVCLDVDGKGLLITNACKCLQGDKSCDPTSQWFGLVQSNTV